MVYFKIMYVEYVVEHIWFFVATLLFSKNKMIKRCNWNLDGLICHKSVTIFRLSARAYPRMSFYKKSRSSRESFVRQETQYGTSCHLAEAFCFYHPFFAVTFNFVTLEFIAVVHFTGKVLFGLCHFSRLLLIVQAMLLCLDCTACYVKT